MKLPESLFTVIDWENEERVVHQGTTGTATFRTRQVGDLRIRLVEYSAGYLADHWCGSGHVVYVIDGVILSDLEDGRGHRLTAGMTYLVSDAGDAPHRSCSVEGARLFIVD